MLALFTHRGGKGWNHLYIGEPSTGKTALTRPLLSLFGKHAFVRALLLAVCSLARSLKNDTPFDAQSLFSARSNRKSARLSHCRA